MARDPNPGTLEPRWPGGGRPPGFVGWAGGLAEEPSGRIVRRSGDLGQGDAVVVEVALVEEAGADVEVALVAGHGLGPLEGDRLVAVLLQALEPDPHGAGAVLAVVLDLGDLEQHLHRGGQLV